MREKVRLSDLSILYVCLSENWGTLERRCLLDAGYFRNIGGSSFLLCHEKSLLDVEAEKEDIPRLYFQGDLKGWRSKLNFYFQLQHILQKQQVDIIHSFNYESLPPIGMILRSMTQIPMVYTFNERIELKKVNFFYRWLISRIDTIFTISQNIKDLAEEKFPVNKRKIFVIGAGIDFPAKFVHSHQSGKTKKIMTFISRTEKNLDHLRRYIDSIIPLFHKLKTHNFSPDLIFIFCTDISWYNHTIYQELKRIILERHLEMHFSFETRKLTTESFIDCDIYVGIPQDELFIDQDLYALVTKTPVLLARTSTRLQMIKQGKLGETYHPDDGRELKDQLFRLLTNYSQYLQGLNANQIEIQEFHHFDKYAAQLFSHYEKLYTQRLRYTEKQKKLA
jgi:glycosyltransferase involved in cell wall biosynthesis